LLKKKFFILLFFSTNPISKQLRTRPRRQFLYRAAIPGFRAFGQHALAGKANIFLLKKTILLMRFFLSEMVYKINRPSAGFLVFLD
jgi:hypothetical protein